MKQLFADAGYWIALLNPRDALHERALAATPSGRASILTSQMVLTEFLNFFAEYGPDFRLRAAETVKSIAQSGEVEVVPQTGEQFQRAFSLYHDRPDKSWSLVDCASIQLMMERDLDAALAYDSHFKQAGFSLLLREEEREPGPEATLDRHEQAAASLSSTLWQTQVRRWQHR